MVLQMSRHKAKDQKKWGGGVLKATRDPAKGNIKFNVWEK